MKLYTFRPLQKVIKRSAAYLSIAALFVIAPFLSVLPVNAATPALVQGRANSVGSGTSVSQSFVNSNSAGNLVVVYVIWSNTSTATVTDSRNTFTAVAPASRFSNNQWSSQVFYAKNIGAGANTVRATSGTGVNSFGLIYIHEFSGVDKVNPLDVAVAATGSSGAMNSGAAVTTNAKDLLFAAGASSNSLAAIGPNFTSAINFDGNRTAYKNVTATGSYSATATHSGNAWAMHLVALRARHRPPTPRRQCARTVHLLAHYPQTQHLQQFRLLPTSLQPVNTQLPLARHMPLWLIVLRLTIM